MNSLLGCDKTRNWLRKQAKCFEDNICTLGEKFPCATSQKITNTLADPGGRHQRPPPPPPNRIHFFRFCIRFCQKVYASEASTPPPPNGSATPQREILDPPLKQVIYNQKSSIICHSLHSDLSFSSYRRNVSTTRTQKIFLSPYLTVHSCSLESLGSISYNTSQYFCYWNRLRCCQRH